MSVRPSAATDRQFRTEIVSSEIQVAVISQDESLAKACQAAWVSKGISVHWFSSASSIAELTQQLIGTQWYRILWLDHPLNITSKILNQIALFLHSRSEICIACLPWPMEAKDLSDNFPLVVESNQWSNSLDQRAPYVSIYWYQHVVDLDWPRKFPHPTQSEFVSPYRLTDFLESLIQVLVSPRGGQRLGGQSSATYAASQLLDRSVTTPPLRYKKLKKHTEVHSSLTLQEIVTWASATTSPVDDNNSISPQHSVNKEHHTNDDLPKPISPKKTPLIPITAHVPPRIPKASPPPITAPEPQSPQTLINLEKETARPDIEIPPPPASLHPVVFNADISRQVSIPPVMAPHISRSKMVLGSLLSKTTQSPPTLTGPAFQNTNVRATPPQPLPQVKRFAATNGVTKLSPSRVVNHSTPSQSIEQKIEQIFELTPPSATPISETRSPSQKNKGVERKHRFPFLRRKTKRKNRKVFVAAVVVCVVLGVGVSSQPGMYHQYRRGIELMFSVQPSVSVSTLRRLSVLSTPWRMLRDQLHPGELMQFETQLQSTFALSESIQHSVREVWLSMIGRTATDPETVSAGVAAQLDELYKAYSSLSSASQELPNTPPLPFLSSLSLVDLQTALHAHRRQALESYQIASLLPLFMNQEKQTLAILFQDSQELRPSGGFIEGGALLTIERGKLINKQFFTAAQVDEKLGGSLTPPQDLRSILREERWFFRDSNWDVDQQRVFITQKTFLEKAFNQPISGIITLNSSTYGSFLELSGPMSVVFNDKTVEIDANNIQEQLFTQQTATLNKEASAENFSFFVSKAILESFTEVSEPKIGPLLSLLSQLASRNQITVFSGQESLQSGLKALGWTGERIVPPCPPQIAQNGCVVFPIYQIDTNVGINKVNQKMTKMLELSLIVQKNITVSNYKLSYESGSYSINWPDGQYKNYIRLILPRSISMRFLKVNGSEVLPDQYTLEERENFVILGFLIDVPIQSTTIAEVEFTDLPISQTGSLAVFHQLQPGQKEFPVSISIQYPPEYIPTLIAPEASVDNQEIKFQFVGDHHSFATVKFQ